MKMVSKIISAIWVVLTLGLSSTNLAAESLASFTKDMLKVEGFFNFYYDKGNDKLYLEVDKIKQPFLFQSSLPHGVGSNDIGLDRGQLGETRLVQFENYGNKVLLTQLNTQYRANTENRAEQKSVEQAFAKSVIQGFEIQAKDRSKILIDYTPFLLSDIHGISRTLSNRKQGNFNLDPSRSAVYFARSKGFPKNTELESIISFKGSKPGEYVQQVSPDPYNLTVHLHHSLIELPDDNYQPRAFHPYSGFWSIEYKDYAVGLDDSMSVKMIPRHRLAKKDPTAEKSEAIEPIVYYLDPGTPEPVRSALLEGARWWNQAFEAAGYIDAFQVKMLPEHADPMDVRYNTIQWVHRATRGWSYGASVIDPRTGEIIKGHVTLGSLRVRQDYLIAQGLTAPFANGKTDTTNITQMALARIKQLSAHEVGHTLGIAHNFAASVNNRASVMDYPHPFVSLVDDKIDLSQAYDNKIGEWDKYVIKYGYTDFANKEQEELALTNLVTETKKKGLLYLSDPDARPISGAHPQGHLWDNGSNAAEELDRMMEVRKFALANFGLDNLAANRPLSDLEEILIPIYLFHRFQTEAATKLIAGLDYSYDINDGSSQSVTMVSAQLQQQALTSVLKTINPKELVIPTAITDLIPPKAYGSARYRESAPSKTGLVFDPLTLATAAAGHSLKGLLNAPRLNRIAQQSAQNSELWTTAEYIKTVLHATIQAPSLGGTEGLIHQRVAALTIELLMQRLHDDATAIEVKADIFAQLSQLNSWLLLQNINVSTGYSGFYQLVSHHLSWYFEHRKWLPLIKPTAMPPGSPI